jgi:hypothetical protein
MKKISIFRNAWFVLLLGALLLSGCGVKAVEPVVAMVATNAPAVVNAVAPTAVPAEVDTPLPSPAEAPAAEASADEAPAPVRMLYSVQNERFEVKVLGLEWPTHANPDGKSFIYPGPGNMFLGLGIRVRNLTGSDIDLKWDQVYLVNKYQDKFYPMWGAYKQTNQFVDPLNLEILEFAVHPDYDPDAHVYLGDNGFMRAIFRVPRDNLYYYFGFADLPLIEINWRYHK